MSNQPQQLIPHSIAQIMLATSQVFKVTVADLLSYKRPKHLSIARMAAMALCRRHTRYSLMDIGHFFANRDHTTVIHAINRLPEIETDKHYAHLVHALCAQVAPPIDISKTSVQSSDFTSEFLKPVTATFSGYPQPTAP